VTLFDTETPAAGRDPLLSAAGPGPAGDDRGEAVVAPPAGSNQPRVVGLDLSLRRTGVVTPDGAFSLIPPAQLKGYPRMRWIRASVLGHTVGADLVVVEAPAFSSNQARAKEIAGLWHVVMIAVDIRGARWIDVMSNTLKVYATGKGSGVEKDAMVIAAVKRLPIDVANNDEADAAWLYALGLDLLDQPLIALPATHRRALNAIRTRLQTTGDHA
jgi:hypothetical protein